MSSIETLERAIEETQGHLNGRETKRLIAWAIVTLIVFFIPIVLFFNLSSDSVFATNYAPIVIVWLMVSLGVSNVIATTLVAPRTVELKLSLATATSLLSLLKANESTDPEITK